MFVPARMCMLTSGYKNYSPPGLPCGFRFYQYVKDLCRVGRFAFRQCKFRHKKIAPIFWNDLVMIW